MSYHQLASAACGIYKAQAYSDAPPDNLRNFTLYIRVTPSVQLDDLWEEVMPDIGNRPDFELMTRTPATSVWCVDMSDTPRDFPGYLEGALDKLVRTLHRIDTGEYFTGPA